MAVDSNWGIRRLILESLGILSSPIELPGEQLRPDVLVVVGGQPSVVVMRS